MAQRARASARLAALHMTDCQNGSTTDQRCRDTRSQPMTAIQCYDEGGFFKSGGFTFVIVSTCLCVRAPPSPPPSSIRRPAAERRSPTCPTHACQLCCNSQGMSVQCRVAGCGLWLRSPLGEHRHVLHVYPGVSDLEIHSIDTICMESDESEEPESHDAAVEVTATAAGTGTVGVQGVLGLDSEVCLDLARNMTRRPPPSPPSPRRRGRGLRGMPSERDRNASRSDTDAQYRRRRNRLRGGPANQRDGSVGDCEESNGEPC